MGVNAPSSSLVAIKVVPQFTTVNSAARCPRDSFSSMSALLISELSVQCTTKGRAL